MRQTWLRCVTFHIPAEEGHLFRFAPAQGEVEIRMLSLRVQRERQPFELHVVHVPPGSRHGWRKIDCFRSVFDRLATRSETPRILRGDFNEPRHETKDGILTWAEKNKYAKKDPKKWATAVENVLLGLEKFDLADAFRTVHSDDLHELWSVKTGNQTRRYDHVFASSLLRAARAEYLPLNTYLSDHRAAIVDFGG